MQQSNPLEFDICTYSSWFKPAPITLYSSIIDYIKQASLLLVQDYGLSKKSFILARSLVLCCAPLQKHQSSGLIIRYTCTYNDVLIALLVAVNYFHKIKKRPCPMQPTRRSNKNETL